MTLVVWALRHPFTVLVFVVAIIAGAVLSIRKTPADIFPNLGVPVVYVVQPYGGMAPSQVEGQLVGYYEYHFLYINGIEHIESQSVQGIGLIKIYFHPGTNIAQAMAQVTAMAFRATSFMPPGTQPPFIVRFDAGSIPVGQLVFSSDQRTEAETQDLALYKVRPTLATLPGVSAPPPNGGRVRMIVAYLDPERLRSYGISPDEVATAVARSNLTLPSGNVRVGDLNEITASDAMVSNVKDLETIPLRTGAGPSVLLRDVGRVEDGADVVTNIALVNGRRTVYMPVSKTADASTLDVVANLKDALPRMRDLLPDDVHVSLEFDQSVYVKNSIRGLITEGVLGAILTALTVLVFLRSLRSALVVVVTIPLSLLSSLIALRVAGETINIMTLSGLALAVGILVDEATVAIENIHSHLAGGKPAGRAVVDAMREVSQPQLLAMLCILAVFIPTFFMVGIGRALFPPLALAVGFSMIASFALARTLVPVLSVWLFRDAKPRPHVERSVFSRLVDSYAKAAGALVRHKWIAIAIYGALCAPAFLLAGRVGTELFPSVDTGQFALRIRAPSGTRVERTEEIVRGVESTIRAEVGDASVRMTLANIGPPQWTAPVNALYTFNTGSHEAMLLVALEPGNRPSLGALRENLRRELAAKYPDVRFSFEAGDIVSQVLNLGAPTPIQVTVSGKNLADARAFAERVRAALLALPQLRDVQIPIALDYPTLAVKLDRERAGQLGVTVDRVGRSIVSATSSSALTTPIFWTDPSTGQPYRVQLRVPESEIHSADDLANLPVMQDGTARPLLGDIATIRPGTAPGELDHYNSQRTISVTANVTGADLGSTAADVEQAVRSLGVPPKGVTVAIHGQVEQMRTTLDSLQTGLLLAIAVVLLMLAANFQSLRDPLVVIATMPAVLAGVLLALYLTDSTLNVQSMMGAIMSIGVSVANAVLLVSFAKARRGEGLTPSAAALAAAKSRLRPILMTASAMIVGMIPTAIAFGEGGEQSAPLGRAVIGGLAASTVATLVFLPAVYAVVSRRGTPRSASLDPDDPAALGENP